MEEEEKFIFLSYFLLFNGKKGEREEGKGKGREKAIEIDCFFKTQRQEVAFSDLLSFWKA